MQNECSIRKATVQDLPWIKEIMNEAILNTTAIYDYAVRDDAYVHHWLQSLRSSGMPVLVCEQVGRCVAYGSYQIFRPKDGYRYCVEHSVYVHPAFVGKGIGAQLLTALIDAARAEGYHTMVAGIDAENKGSILFHQKFGFTEVGLLKEVGYKFDRWLDLVFMQKVL